MNLQNRRPADLRKKKEGSYQLVSLYGSRRNGVHDGRLASATWWADSVETTSDPLHGENLIHTRQKRIVRSVGRCEPYADLEMCRGLCLPETERPKSHGHHTYYCVQLVPSEQE